MNSSIGAQSSIPKPSHEAKVNLEIASQNLKRILGLPLNEQFVYTIPPQIPALTISPELALSEARNNRKALVDFKNQRLEADASQRPKG